MTRFDSEIILFDAHELRGCALKEMIEATRVVRKCDLHNCDLESESEPGSIPVRIVTTGGQSNLGIYVTGGRPLSHPDVILCLSRIFAHFPDIAVVALCDEYSPEDVAMALHLGLQGIIPSRLPKKVALAAIEVVLAGGCYFSLSDTDTKVPVGLPAHAIVGLIENRSDFGIALSSRCWSEAMAEDELATSARDPHLTPRQIEVLEAPVRITRTRG